MDNYPDEDVFDVTTPGQLTSYDTLTLSGISQFYYSGTEDV